jgi:ribonuclease HI
MQVAGPQTVNWSEFVRKYAVLEDVNPERSVSVYTDSLVSIQKLIAWVADHASLDGDKHQDIGRDIATMIAHRQGPYRLRKVPAHKDMKWNEVADATAKSTARATPADNLPVRGPDRPRRENVYRPSHGDVTI